MEIINPSFEIITPQEQLDGIPYRLELAGRTCYKSEDVVTHDSNCEFLKKIIKLGHESVLEHEIVSCRVITDRGVTHEIVRHRLASYSQESTRYCNYSDNAKRQLGIKFIRPEFDLTDRDVAFLIRVEDYYNECIANGRSPQQARYFLPNGLKTEIVMTLNLRAWRHFFNLRTAKGAHPQMRQIANPMLEAFKGRIPIIFDDL
jgi:thymidylate synthase (FAD)